MWAGRSAPALEPGTRSRCAGSSLRRGVLVSSYRCVGCTGPPEVVVERELAARLIGGDLIVGGHLETQRVAHRLVGNPVLTPSVGSIWVVSITGGCQRRLLAPLAKNANTSSAGRSIVT